MKGYMDLYMDKIVREKEIVKRKNELIYKDKKIKYKAIKEGLEYNIEYELYRKVGNDYVFDHGGGFFVYTKEDIENICDLILEILIEEEKIEEE